MATPGPHSEQVKRTSVLLATYNRRALLPRVLEPILADPATNEVVVVVDGCDDGSIELLTELSQRDPRLRPHYVTNRGAARALLAGAKIAQGDLLVIVDDDEIVSPGSIGRHAAHHTEHDDLVVVGFVAMSFPPSRRPGDPSRYLYANQYDRDCATWVEDPSRILLNLWGGFISLGRTNYVRATESAHEFVDGYHYDLDFGARCLELGLEARFDPTLKALHLYERSTSAYLRDGRSSGRNRILVHRAHPTVLPAIDPGFAQRGLPPVGRAALRLIVRFPFLLRWLGTATRIVGHMHLWRLENGGAALMFAVEQQRGALEAAETISAAGAAPYRPVC